MVNGFRRIIANLSLLFLVGLPGPSLSRAQQNKSGAELLEQFKTTTVFWQQLEVARKIVELRDPSVLPRLRTWLTEDDRHLRGNAAFIFAGLGDNIGIEVIAAILNDYADRPEGQGILMAGRWSLQQQIAADRYYAVHLLGELGEAKTVSILTPLLNDPQVNYKVAWALGEIGGKAAVQSLVELLHDKSPDVRVIAIESLGKLDAKDALPILRPLLDDNERSHFGNLVSVAEGARAAIARLEKH
jgi:HEAT repeat protein